MSLTNIFVGLAEIIAGAVIIYFVVLNLIYLLQGLAAMKMLKHYFRQLRAEDLVGLSYQDNLPSVSILIPAYNEVTTCCETVQALLDLEYPHYEIIVINDGSTDQTLQRLNEHFDLCPALHVNPYQLTTAPVNEVYCSRLHPNVWVIDKENGGKADALNAGLNYCNMPFFCAVDADTLLEKDALRRIMLPFLLNRHTVAVGGIIKVLNGCKVEQGRIQEVCLPQRLLPAIQVVEYLRSFLAGRMSWNLLQGSLIISGAFGVFRHTTVLAAGGYNLDTVGEDMELVVRLHRHCAERDKDYQITFVPDPVAWTQCPETLAGLYSQRERWQRGLVQSLFKHLGMLFNPRYGQTGLVTFPFFFFLEMLGPLVEVAGYLAMLLLLLANRLSLSFLLLFLGVAVGMGLAISFLALILAEMNIRRFENQHALWKLAGIALLENLGYRQLLACWRAGGILTALLGKRSWGQIQRYRFSASVARSSRDA